MELSIEVILEKNNINQKQLTMSKVAKLVYYTFVTRVVVEEKASDDEIIIASKKNMLIKVQSELGENLEEICDDEECPIGTFETDLPTIDRVILSEREKQYIVIGKGLPVQVVSFHDFSDWDSVNDLDGNAVFDVQIDFDDSVKLKNTDEYYQFQYVNLVVDEKGDISTGMDYQGVKVERLAVNDTIGKFLANMLSKNLDKSK
jgi:hypothetical protein